MYMKRVFSSFTPVYWLKPREPIEYQNWLHPDFIDAQRYTLSAESDYYIQFEADVRVSLYPVQKLASGFLWLGAIGRMMWIPVYLYILLCSPEVVRIHMICLQLFSYMNA